jgi:hypothetical protein
MNTVQATTERRLQHPPQPARRPQSVRRVGLLDRAALHLGVALIAWGRRPLAAESRERLASRAEQRQARLAREQAAERWLHLNLPRR